MAPCRTRSESVDFVPKDLHGTGRNDLSVAGYEALEPELGQEAPDRGAKSGLVADHTAEEAGYAGTPVTAVDVFERKGGPERLRLRRRNVEHQIADDGGGRGRMDKHVFPGRGNPINRLDRNFTAGEPRQFGKRACVLTPAALFPGSQRLFSVKTSPSNGSTPGRFAVA